MKMKWAVGDKVMAKWPGSALYFHAEVKSIDAEEESAEVLYSDGTEMEIPLKFIKSEAAFSQTKRAKSPARTRRRSRSPGRSPGRKPRVQKKDEDTKPRRSRSNSRNRSKVLNTSSSSSDEKKVTITGQSTEKVVTTYSSTTMTKTKLDITSTAVPDTRYIMTRQRVRDTASFKATDVVTNSKPETYEMEYGGVLGVFLMYLTMPLLPLIMLVACNDTDCSITKFTRSMIPCNLEAYFSIKSFVIVLGFLLFHAIIYALPFGYIIKGPFTPKGDRLDYRISARYTLVITFGTYVALLYNKVPLTFIHDELLQLAFAATILSYIGTLLVYIASFFTASELNPAGTTGSHLYDSFIGRELHPRIGKLFDLKLYLYRPAMAGMLVLIWIEMGREYELNGNKHAVQLLIVSVSQVLYIIFEFFLDEEQCPYMFDIKNEGLGFVQFFGELVIVPFVYSLPIRYVVDHPTELPLPRIIGVIALLCMGFLLVFLSGKQKSEFRKNPYNTSLSNLESLPPSRPDGQRILVGGYWGIVRHPNYLGEIVIGVAWSVACGFNHLLPWFYPIFVTILLCHRSVRDDVRCRQKHGHVWKIYCERVKHKVIPYIF